MKKYQEQISVCKNLDELVAALNEITENLDDLTLDQVVDLAGLPVFGEHPVQDTREVFSWDERNILVAGDREWVIEPRCEECGEATFHCKHE